MAELSPAAARPTLPAIEPRVVLEDVDIGYPRPDGSVLRVVAGISFSVAEGEFVAIVGPSGCGKSTVLRALSGLLRPLAGAVRVDGLPVEGPPEHVGFMFQKDTLLPWATVASNIGVGAELGGVPAADRPARIAELVRLLRLDGFADAYPSRLSGGMRQRVALGRMLAYAPRLMLMDEPFGALDFQTKVVLGRELLRVWEAERRSIVFVTHDIEEAVTLADRVIVFSPRPATIVADYRIDLPRPRQGRALRADRRFAAVCEAVWADLQLPE